MSELRQRQPRVEDRKFLAFVRTQPCCACGRSAPSHAAHVRMASAAHGKRETGKHEKPSDRWSVALCARCHLGDQHVVGERTFWSTVGIDPFAVATQLWNQYRGVA